MPSRLIGAMVVTALGVQPPTPSVDTHPDLSRPKCRATDFTAERTLDRFREILASTTSLEVGLRRGIGLTYQPTPTVGLVHDEVKCRAAVAALNGHFETPDVARSVYLYDLGTEYAVEDLSMEPRANTAGFGFSGVTGSIAVHR